MRRCGLAAGWFLLALVSAGGATADAPAAVEVRVQSEDQVHWAFQPVRRPEVPRVRNQDWVSNPIDAFILARLEANGLEPAPLVEPRQLLRRLTFDLIGLPPTPEEIDDFLAAWTRSDRDGALEQVVDRLLASPHHGERWGRYWLDLVRFGETNGYERDGIKPNAWKYRDYVVRSLNADKPYNRFVLEQIAGDELPDADGETLIATGFHRVGPWDDEPADSKQDRFDQLDDIVRTTSSVFLGLTLGCARCHDHKFEPLTMLDYYRLVAVFDPLTRPTLGRLELDLPVGTPEQLRALAERDRRLSRIRSWIDELRQAFRADYLSQGRSGLPAEAVAALLVEPAQRTPEQKSLAERHAKALDAELAAALPDATRRAIAGLEGEINRLRAETPDLPRGYFFEERSSAVPKTRLLLRGQAATPGPEVEPGVPAVLAPRQPAQLTPVPTGQTTGRRLALARWIARPENPLTARVLVNRVWQFHMGEGLVRTPSDFGTFGAEPTHPELLDWLTDWFVGEGWSLKKLHRLIVTSRTYQMSKRWHAEAAAQDPENLLYWRLPYRRLDAEAIRDAMLAVSGQLDRKLGGPSVYPEIPREALEAHADLDKIWKPFDERQASRRTLYAMVRRSLVIPMLEVLDFCDTTQSSPQRGVTSTAPQALTLLNGAFTQRQARHFAERLRREVGEEAQRQVERAYLLAVGRPPSASERASLVRFLEQEGALERVCRVLFNLNEFVYLD